MQPTDSYDSERTATPAEAAAVLSSVADGLLTGSIRLGEADEAVAIDVPDELDLEVEFEQEDGELSLELELEWPAPAEADGVVPLEDASAGEVAREAPIAEGSGGTEDEKAGAGEEPTAGEESAAIEKLTAGDTAAAPPTDEVPVPVGATDATESLARFEVYRDRGDQWRWRLRHRNGNIIATSGEGYTRKHNAWKGLESVMANAPEAAVREDAE